MNWYRKSSTDLPPLPSGFVRCVHVAQASPDRFWGGFNYESQGMLQSTARIFSSNEALLAAGLFYKYDRRYNSGYAVILDIPAEEARYHQSILSSPGFIPGRFVYGAYGSEEQKWFLNPVYDPSGSSLPDGYIESLTKSVEDHRKMTEESNRRKSVPGPDAVKTETDVW